MAAENPFALSLCGRYVVERHPGEVYPTVMAVDEAMARRDRLYRDADRYVAEGEPDMARECRCVAASIVNALHTGSVGRLAA